MRKSDLVPVVRPDVNGKLVTRHVLPSKAITGSKAIPSPAIASPAMDSKTCSFAIARALTSEFEEGHFSAFDGSLSQRELELARTYEESLSHENLIEMANRAAGFTPDEKHIFEYQVPTLFNDWTVQYAPKRDRDMMFRGVLENIDLFARFYPVAFGGDHLRYISKGALRNADRLGIDPLADSEFQQKMYRFFIFKEIAGEWRVLDHEEACEKADWFAENERLILPHAEAIRTRDLSWEWMVSLTDPDAAPSLSEGTL